MLVARYIVTMEWRRPCHACSIGYTPYSIHGGDLVMLVAGSLSPSRTPIIYDRRPPGLLSYIPAIYMTRSPMIYDRVRGGKKGGGRREKLNPKN
jgi:hypothetical protein